jgi:2-polyprenyl-3-methyl-5-hydroxy-6-metoxy-1,4-benzoquinol methylase
MATKTEDLIDWKTNAWKNPDKVAWYARRMVENTGTNRLKNQVEVDLCAKYVAGRDILDVGIGTGRASLPLARRGFNLTGVDSSQAMLDECRHLAAEVPILLMLGDVSNLPVQDGQYDTLLSLNVMTHFPHWREVMAEWKRVVRPGGRIVFDIYSLDHLSYVSGRTVGIEEILDVRVDNFTMHIEAEALIAEADRLGLTVAAIVPYGSLFSGRYRRFNDSVPLLEQQWWQRQLAWTTTDDRMLDFALFLEQRLFAHLTSITTGRFMAVLENRFGKAANEEFLRRNRLLNELLVARPSLSSLTPYLSEPMEEWRETLNRHLDYTRNRVLFYFLATSMFNSPDALDMPFFLEDRHVRKFRRWLEAEKLDWNLLQVLGAWHGQKEVAEALSFQGVPLGVGLEYEITRDVLKRYAATNGDRWD